MKKFTRGGIEAFIGKYATDVPVLDIGAGSTEYSRLFPKRTTLDIDPARKPDVVGDVNALPFGDNSWDVVLCSEVFEHLSDPRRAVNEMRRVLKPGGLLVLTTRFVYPIHDAPGDYLRYTPYMLRELFREWDIQEVIAESGPFSTIAILLQRIIFQTDLRGGKVTKGLLYLLALVLRRADFLVLRQWGDIKRSAPVDVLMSSGVYIACRTRK